MEVKPNPYNKTMLGSALLFLTIYLGTILYSILPFTINQFFPNLDLTPATSGWSGFSAASNNTIVSVTHGTMSAWSIGSLLPLALFSIIILVLIMMLMSTRFAYKMVR